MTVSFRLCRKIVPAVMLMAVTASLAGPSFVSAMSLLDGSETTMPDGGTHLPLDMAAAPDQTAEAADSSIGLDGSARDVQADPGTLSTLLSMRPVEDVNGADGGICASLQSLLCVYRL